METKMTFETEYQLQQFEEIKSEYFTSDGECWKGHHPANHIRIMEQMHKLIYQLVSEINRMPNLLHEYFNHKSDANKYLFAEQQEDLEKEFEEWVKNNNHPSDQKSDT